MNNVASPAVPPPPAALSVETLPTSSSGSPPPPVAAAPSPEELAARTRRARAGDRQASALVLPLALNQQPHNASSTDSNAGPSNHLSIDDAYQLVKTGEVSGLELSDELIGRITRHGMVGQLVSAVDLINITSAKDDAAFMAGLQQGFTVQYDGASCHIDLETMKRDLHTFESQLREAHEQGHLSTKALKRQLRNLKNIHGALNSLGTGEQFQAPSGGRAAVISAALSTFLIGGAVSLIVPYRTGQRRYSPVMTAAYVKSFIILLEIAFNGSSHWGTVSTNFRQKHLVNLLANVAYLPAALVPEKLGHLENNPVLIAFATALTLIGFVIRAEPSALPKLGGMLTRVFSALAGAIRRTEAQRPAPHLALLKGAGTLKRDSSALKMYRDQFNKAGGELGNNRNASFSEVFRYYQQALDDLLEAMRPGGDADRSAILNAQPPRMQQWLREHYRENIFLKHKSAITILGIVILGAATVVQGLPHPPGQSDAEAEAAHNGTVNAMAAGMAKVANPAGLSDMAGDFVGVVAGLLWMTIQKRFNKQDAEEAFSNFIGLSLLTLPFLAPDVTKNYLSQDKNLVAATVGLAASNLLLPGMLGKMGSAGIMALLDYVFPTPTPDGAAASDDIELQAPQADSLALEPADAPAALPAPEHTHNAGTAPAQGMQDQDVPAQGD